MYVGMFTCMFVCVYICMYAVKHFVYRAYKYVNMYVYILILCILSQEYHLMVGVEHFFLYNLARDARMAKKIERQLAAYIADGLVRCLLPSHIYYIHSYIFSKYIKHTYIQYIHTNMRRTWNRVISRFSRSACMYVCIYVYLLINQTIGYIEHCRPYLCIQDHRFIYCMYVCMNIYLYFYR